MHFANMQLRPISRVAFSPAIPRYARHKLTKKQSRLLASQFLNRGYSLNSLTHDIFAYKILRFENIIFAGHKPHLFCFARD